MDDNQGKTPKSPDKPKKDKWRETLEALLTALIVAFLIRSFVIEPFKIPSRSMVPTLLVGDFIFVNKFAYGIRIPFTKKWAVKGEDPKRGDVVVFIYPASGPSGKALDYIKRVVGVPGDEVRYDGRDFYVNGKKLEKRDYDVLGIDSKDPKYLAIADPERYPEPLRKIPYSQRYDQFDVAVEDLDGVTHLVQYYDRDIIDALDEAALRRGMRLKLREPFTLTVPEANFFVMGDNRDESEDSRYWGFVPRENLEGKAMFRWLSLDYDGAGLSIPLFGRTVVLPGIRLSRFGEGIH